MELIRNLFRLLLGIGLLMAVITSGIGISELVWANADKNEPDEPVVQDLAAWESGAAPKNRHVKLEGDMVALHNLTFSMMKSKDNKEVVDKFYYPLIRAASVMASSKPTTFCVLVEQDGIGRKAADVNGEPEVVHSMSGMLTTSTGRSLDRQIQDHFKKHFPDVDWSKVHVLRMGQKPFGAGKADRFAGGRQLLWIGLPATLVLVGLLWVTRGRRAASPVGQQEKAAQAETNLRK